MTDKYLRIIKPRFSVWMSPKCNCFFFSFLWCFFKFSCFDCFTSSSPACDACSGEWMKAQTNPNEKYKQKQNERSTKKSKEEKQIAHSRSINTYLTRCWCSNRKQPVTHDNLFFSTVWEHSCHCCLTISSIVSTVWWSSYERRKTIIPILFCKHRICIMARHREHTHTHNVNSVPSFFCRCSCSFSPLIIICSTNGWCRTTRKNEEVDSGAAARIF